MKFQLLSADHTWQSSKTYLVSRALAALQCRNHIPQGIILLAFLVTFFCRKAFTWQLIHQVSEVSCLLLKCLVFSCDYRRGVSYVSRIPCSVATFPQRLIGTSGDHQITPSAQSKVPLARATCPIRLWVSPRVSTDLSQQPVPGSDYPHRQKKVFSLSRISCISVCAHDSVFTTLPNQPLRWDPLSFLFSRLGSLNSCSLLTQ